MKTSNLLLLIALAIVLLATTVFVGYTKTQLNRECIEASGPIEVREIEVGPYTKISVSQKVKVVLTQNGQQKVTVRAEQNLMDYLFIQVNDNSLDIGCKACITDMENVLVEVSVDSIERIKVQSAGQLKTSGELSGNELELVVESAGQIDATLNYIKLRRNLSSGGEARLTGQVETSQIDANSGGQYNGIDLKAINCSVEVNSGAGATVSVSNHLRADASSGAQIRYAGEPKTKDVNSSSGGMVTQVE